MSERAAGDEDETGEMDTDETDERHVDIRFVLCDLDGVVWLDREAIPGAADAVARLRSAGCRVLFVTNNSMSVVGSHEAALAAIGIPATGDVVSSAQAAAALVAAGERVLVCGGPGVVEAVEARGAEAVGPAAGGDVDAVIVGLHQHFDYAGLYAASTAIRRGARFLATNDDVTLPTPTGPAPGAGALVAAVAAASEQAPTIAGKPYRPMAELVRTRCGPGFAPGTALMVGDRWSTDALFADALGCRFALVRSGVTAPGAPLPVAGSAPAIDVVDLAAVADRVLAGRAIGGR